MESFTVLLIMGVLIWAFAGWLMREVIIDKEIESITEKLFWLFLIICHVLLITIAILSYDMIQTMLNM